MSEVFLCQKGQLDSRSKRDLRAAGVVVVEVEDITACQSIRATEIVGQDDMLWAVFDALRSPQKLSYGEDKVLHQQYERLAKNLFDLVFAARTKRLGSE